MFSRKAGVETLLKGLAETTSVLKLLFASSERPLSAEPPPTKITLEIVLLYFFSKANNTLLAFEKKYNKTISKVILVGGGSALKGLSELAKSNFKTDVVSANPFSKVSTPAFLENILKSTGPEFAVAIGLALRKLAEEG